MAPEVCWLFRPLPASRSREGWGCTGGAPRLKLPAGDPITGVPLAEGEPSLSFSLASALFALCGVDAAGGRRAGAGDLRQRNQDLLLMPNPAGVFLVATSHLLTSVMHISGQGTELLWLSLHSTWLAADPGTVAYLWALLAAQLPAGWEAAR